MSERSDKKLPGGTGDNRSRSLRGRRAFITTTLAALGAAPLLAMGGARDDLKTDERDEMKTGDREKLRAGDQEDLRAGDHAPMTIQQVIDLILADIPGAPFPQTVDTIKSGNPTWPVRGIVTTMFATDAVIQKTIDLGANFIIAHEPTFYNHADETNWLTGDKVYGFKKDLLEKHEIVVWRFHDGWHAHRPDGILMGVLTSLGWDKYYDTANPHVVTIPGSTLGEIIELNKKRLGIEKVKMIGDLSQTCRKIALLPGAGGGRAQIGMFQKYGPDLLICGELNEWETSEYVRDARYQGQKISLVVLGHSVSEEPGMEWLVPMLQPRLPGIRVTHIPSGDSLQTI